MSKSIYDSITALPGVGEKRAEILAQLEIYTIFDLLLYYPFRYEDIQVKDIDEVQDQEKVTLKGTVVSEPVVARFGRQKNRLNFRIRIDHAVIMVTFFNQPYLKSKVAVGEEIAVYGKWDGKRKSLMGMKIIATQEEDGEEKFQAIYHVNKKIRQTTLVQLVQLAYENYQDVIPELIPSALRQKYRLLSQKETILQMHFPTNPEMRHQARRQAVFLEFFLFQMQIQLLRLEQKQVSQGHAILYDVDRLRKFTEKLPFELTRAQKRVVNEICKDLRATSGMHRLLQGDVGSGKTIVAAIVLYATVIADFQGALMVPTEILAEQHMESLQELFDPLEVNIALLTGSTKAKEKREIYDQLAIGEIDIVVGTHALIQEDVVFKKLGLVITDEQHRFGVKQRQTLREKGENVNVLFMTATPIPRTLAITVYGEMDVSVIDEMPAGRIPVETTWIQPKSLELTLRFIEKQLENGSQAYVICPLIEESEAMDLKNATDIYENLSQFFAPKYQVGLLHGKMKAAEKDQIMESFKENELQVLVSTTVIEVGVNVPNATVMLIYDADRFGLAQLHQLRGRVGRGKKASYCILVANPKNELGKERMKIMTETNNGFELSERDLALRGPGDVFGAKQSGMPDFKVGDIVGDFGALEAARDEASQLVKEADFYQTDEYQSLRQYLGVKRQIYTSFD